MIEKIKGFIEHNYFDSKFPLDYKIYMIFFLESYIIAFIGAAANTILFRSLVFVVPQWLFILLCTVLLFVKPKTRMSLQKAHLIFLTLVYIPFIYFQTGGYDGSALLFSIIGILALTVAFTGSARFTVVFLALFVNLLCVVINYYFPGFVIPLESPEIKFIDLFLSLILAMIGTAIMSVQITQAFQKKNDELSEISIRDSLTGSYNRRFLYEHLEYRLGSGPYHQQHLGVLMMDLDHFKSINDTYGHNVGDEVLVAFTNAVQMTLRGSDILVRYGGEEFITLLHDVSFESAQIIAERIRSAVSKLYFDNDIQLTVSIGLILAQPGDSAEDLINKADQCLYRAKKAGRNQICRND